MQKPSDYDEVQVMGDFTPIELGGHHLIIKGVKEQQSKKGDPMLVIAFDFAKNDRQPGYFSDLFEKDIRPDKKWPANGTHYLMTQDWQDKSKTSSRFKGFITSFEKSNNCEAVWGDNFCQQFTGKKIGGVFGIVEEEYNGKVSQRHKLSYFRADEGVEKANIPNPKLLKDSNSATDKDGFMVPPAGSEEEIPF